jgi:AraC family transcriptional regulator
VLINNKPHEYQVGNVCFVTPGTKVQFFYTGPNTFAYEMTFGIVQRTETVVIPAIADLGEFTDLRRKEFKDADDWGNFSIMRGLACAFNVLWSIAKQSGQIRKSDMVAQAEGLIMKQLHSQINIAKMCADLGISHNHLLRLFQDEHHCTIQSYIRDMRAEIARQMITDTLNPIKEIATKVGCQDLQYFNKLIRNTTGMSPSMLRQQAINRTRH